MSKQAITQWKSEQRELLRAAFEPAFSKYTEMVHRVNEPDDYRKYLEFIAKQVGLEEVVPKASPHDGLTTVHINIGQFHQSARALNAAPFSVIPDADVVDATPTDTPQVVSELPAPAYTAGLAAQLAADVVEPVNDFDSLLDFMVPA